MITNMAGCKHCDGTDHLSEKCKWKKRVYENKRCKWCRRTFVVETAYQNRTHTCGNEACLLRQKQLDAFCGEGVTTMLKVQCYSCMEPRHLCRCRR